MSASREKKRRQENLGQGPTQKQIREEQEAQKRRRNTIIYVVIGIVAVVAVVALLVWNSGFFQRRTTAATVGSTKFTVGEMQCYYTSARQSELQSQQLASYGYSHDLPEGYNTYDFNSELGDEQICDPATGMTYEEYFEQLALEAAQEVTALVNAAKADGISLSEEGKTTLATQMENLSSTAASYNYPNATAFLAANYGYYVTEGIYRSILSDQILASEYSNSHQDSLSYSNEDYDAYARENPANVYSYDYRLAFISGAVASRTDEEGNTIEPTDEEKAAAMEAAKAKADSMVAILQEASVSKRSDLFSTQAAEILGESSSFANPEYNLQTGVLGQNIASSIYYSWLTDTARVKGDVVALEGSASTGYYVVLFQERYLNNADTVDVRHILIKAELPTEDDPDTEVDERTVPTEEQMEAAHTQAQELLDEFLAGDKTEKSFGELAKEHSADTGSASNGGLYTYVEEGQMIETFNDWIFDPARQSGDTGLVKNENANMYGWHVMYFVQRSGPKWHDVADQVLIRQDMEEWIEGLKSSYEVKATGGMSQVH